MHLDSGWTFDFSKRQKKHEKNTETVKWLPKLIRLSIHFFKPMPCVICIHIRRDAIANTSTTQTIANELRWFTISHSLEEQPLSSALIKYRCIGWKFKSLSVRWDSKDFTLNANIFEEFSNKQANISQRALQLMLQFPQVYRWNFSLH